MGKASRDKGKRGEKETVSLMEKIGFPESTPGDIDSHCFRCKQYRGADVDGPDVLATGMGIRLAVESKLKNKESIKAVLKKAEEDCPKGYLPIVRWRRDREEATIHMPEWAFVKLMQRIGDDYEKMEKLEMVRTSQDRAVDGRSNNNAKGENDE